MIYIKNIFKISFVIIGTIIGAGFASGKEIYTFFCTNGLYGFFSLCLSNFLIGIILYISFKFIFVNNIESYLGFTKYLVGDTKLLNYTINNLMNIFLLISFTVMIAGFGSYFSQEFNLPIIYGALIISITSFFVFSSNINGVIKINSFLIPILIFFILLLGIKCNILSFNFYSIIPINSVKTNWIINSFLYASYNSIILIPILINLNKHINNIKQIKQISFFTVFFILILSIIIFIVLSINIKEITHIEIPIIFIVKPLGNFYILLYSFVILSAIFTTAVSSGFSFLKSCARTKKQYLFLSIFICIFSVFFCNFGFGNLINFLYPILGYVGIFEFILLFIKYIKLQLA